MLASEEVTLIGGDVVLRVDGAVTRKLQAR